MLLDQRRGPIYKIAKLKALKNKIAKLKKLKKNNRTPTVIIDKSKL